MTISASLKQDVDDKGEWTDVDACGCDRRGWRTVEVSTKYSHNPPLYHKFLCVEYECGACHQRTPITYDFVSDGARERSGRYQKINEGRPITHIQGVYSYNAIRAVFDAIPHRDYSIDAPGATNRDMSQPSVSGDSHNNSGRRVEGRRKRERRKAFRNKKQARFSETQLTEMDCEWDFPPLHKLVGRISDRPLYRSLFTVLRSGNASEIIDEFISPPCHRVLSELRVQSVCALKTIAWWSSHGFCTTRIKRLIDDSVPSIFGNSPAQLMRSRVTSPQMRTFLRKLFTAVFPMELIGSKNWDRLIDNFVRALGDMRTRSQLFPRDQMCAGLRYDGVEWLHTVPFAIKALVVKHLARFLSRFVAHVLSCYFYVTDTSAMRVSIYRRNVWAKIAVSGRQIFIARGKWKVVPRRGDADATAQVCTFALRFIPKGLFVRPVVKFNNSPAVVHKLKRVKAILDYIIATKPWCMAFGMKSLKSFSSAYRDFALQMRRGEGMALYWAAGDVANCFPSIDHSTLEQLLRNLLGTKEFITLNCWAVSKVKNKSGRPIWRQIYSAGPNRHVAGRLLKLRTKEELGSNPTCTRMSAEGVIEAIRRHVLHAHLKCKALYRSNRGIPQGSSLSWTLCNLYLGAMERKIFEHRPRGLFCRRYVDDYFVVTNNRRNLVDFGKQLVRESDRGFGIRFNWDKMVVSTNLKRRGGEMIALRRKEKLRWCGQAFNTKTMRVTVDYRRYRANPPMLSVPTQLHPTEKFAFICTQTKRLLSHRLRSLRLFSDGHMGAKHRRQLNRGFLNFAFKFYFIKLARALGFEARDPAVRRFLRQLTRWVSNHFPRRDLPQAALPSLAL